jgi:hypothetical protein
MAACWSFGLNSENDPSNSDGFWGEDRGHAILSGLNRLSFKITFSIHLSLSVARLHGVPAGEPGVLAASHHRHLHFLGQSQARGHLIALTIPTETR